MEEIDIIEPQVNKPGFFEHVFSIDDKAKSTLFNIIQYSLTAIIPVTILNKVIQRLFPQPDEEKGNFEILAEVSGQILLTLIGIYFIHRLVTYIPTYSKKKFDSICHIDSILIFFVIVFNLKTKLGMKINILSNRIMELWDGKATEKHVNNETSVQVIQPIVKQLPLPKREDDLKHQGGVNFDQMYNGGRIGTEGMKSGIPGAMYNQMSQQQENNLQEKQFIQPNAQNFNASLETNEPFAANEVLNGFGTSY